MITVSRIDDTQTDFQEGVLTDVEADAGGFLRLADAPVLDFDGVDDYVDCGDINSPSVSGYQLTVEAWVLWDTLEGHRIIFVDGGYVRGYEIGLYNNELHVGVENNDSHRSLGYSIDNLTTGRWYHVAVTLDGVNGAIRIFLDGALVAEDTSLESFTDFDGTNGTFIGAAHNQSPSSNENMGSVTYCHDGLITELRVWSGVKTQAEIQADMNRTLAGDEPGLVAYYPLNEGTGTTVIDNTGTSNGTIYGATWVQNEPLYFMNPDKNNNRISPQINLSKVVTVKDSSISWTETLNGQTINIETRVSFDGGLTWTPWSTCTNGGSIPNLTPSTQVVNALLECRQTLTTTNPAYSPQLETLNITVEGIGMTLLQSFNF